MSPVKRDVTPGSVYTHNLLMWNPTVLSLLSRRFTVLRSYVFSSSHQNSWRLVLLRNTDRETYSEVLRSTRSTLYFQALRTEYRTDIV
jgi:hypothetical protein